MKNLLIFLLLGLSCQFMQAQVFQFQNPGFEDPNCADPCADLDLSCFDGWWPFNGNPGTRCGVDACNGNYSISVYTTSGQWKGRPKTRNPLFGHALNGDAAVLRASYKVISQYSLSDDLIIYGDTEEFNSNYSNLVELGHTNAGTYDECVDVTVALDPSVVDYEFLVFEAKPYGGSHHIDAIMDDPYIEVCDPLRFELAAGCEELCVQVIDDCEVITTSIGELSIKRPDGSFEKYTIENFGEIFEACMAFEEVGDYTVNVLVFYQLGDENSAVASESFEQVISFNPATCCDNLEASFVSGILGTMNDVAFKDVSTTSAECNIISAVWDFGDGTTCETDCEDWGFVFHNYALCGTYTIQLSVEDDCGCTDSYSETIEIKENCTPIDSCKTLDASFEWAMFGANDIVLMNTSATGAECSIVSAVWDFGDGTTCETDCEEWGFVFHNYTECGVYDICLTVEDDCGCIDTYCQTIVIRENCTTDPCENTDLTADFQHWITGNQLAFKYAFDPHLPCDIESMVWDFGDGTTCNDQVGTGCNAWGTNYHYYTYCGTYDLCLTVTDACGCVLSHCEEITISEHCVDPKELRETAAVKTELAKPIQFISNVPNPFKEQTTIAYSLSADASLSLRVFDVNAREVKSINYTEPLAAGEHQVVLALPDVPSGIYYCILEANGHQEVIKLMKIN